MTNRSPIARSEHDTSAGTTHPRLVSFAISLCVALVFGLGAGVNLAVGQLATSDLRPSATEVVWIVDTYLVVFGCLLIPAGAWGDRYGRKGCMVVGLAVLAAGSVISALAPTVPLLLAARVVTGAGAALVLPNSLTLMIQAHSEERRTHAVAVWTAMSGIGGVAGNVGGGCVLQFFDWQALFAAAAPLALVGLVLIARFAPVVERREHAIDVGGVVLLVVTVFLLLFGIVQGQEVGWGSPLILLAFAATVVVGAGFVFHELRQAHPIIDPRELGLPGMRSGVVGIIVSFIAMYSIFYLNGQYLMNVKGFAPVLAGFGTAPLAVVLFLVSPRSATLARRFGQHRVVAVGLAAVVLGLVLFSCCGPHTPYPLYAVCIAVIGAGSALSNPLLSTAIISALPAVRSGVGSGVNSFSREIGGALGFAIFGTILNLGFAARLPEELANLPGTAGEAARKAVGSALAVVDSDRPELVEAVRYAFTDSMSVALRIIAAGLALATIFVVLSYPRSRES